MAFETNRMFGAMAFVSHNYRDESGRDYDALADDLTNTFDRYGPLRIEPGRPRFQVEGNTARVRVRVTATSKPLDGPKNAPILFEGEAEVRLERSDGEWLITGWDLEPSSTGSGRQ